MATASTTPWSPGFSDNPAGEPLTAQSIIAMLDRIGDELVLPPGAAADAPRISRRELLARVLWTRATLDADNTAAKLIIEYLDGKPGETGDASGGLPTFTADDYALAETLAQEEFGHE